MPLNEFNDVIVDILPLFEQPVGIPIRDSYVNGVHYVEALASNYRKHEDSRGKIVQESNEPKYLLLLRCIADVAMLQYGAIIATSVLACSVSE